MPTYRTLQVGLRELHEDDVPHNRDPTHVVADNWAGPSSSPGRRKGFSTGGDP